jgi:hypothetical protein
MDQVSNPRASPAGPKLPDVRIFPAYDWSRGYDIFPVAVRRSFAPPRKSMFVSTHCFVPGTLTRYEWPLAAFVWRACEVAGIFWLDNPLARNTSAVSVITILAFTVLMIHSP